MQQKNDTGWEVEVDKVHALLKEKRDAFLTAVAKAPADSPDGTVLRLEGQHFPLVKFMVERVKGEHPQDQTATWIWVRVHFVGDAEILRTAMNLKAQEFLELDSKASTLRFKLTMHSTRDPASSKAVMDRDVGRVAKYLEDFNAVIEKYHREAVEGATAQMAERASVPARRARFISDLGLETYP